MSKKQWKNVTENLQLQFSTKTISHQDEVDVQAEDVNVIRSILPTKTSATRQISDLESIPLNGPFLLNFANIPFDSTEADLRNFFGAYDIINIIKSEQRRGVGIIEFKDYNGLASALNMHEKLFINRQIRLTIANKEDLTRVQTSGGGQKNRYQNQRNPPTLVSDDGESWRTKKIQPTTNQMQQENSSGPIKERSSWREKNNSRITSDDKSGPTNNNEFWRRPKVADTQITRQPMPTKDVKSTVNASFNRSSASSIQSENETVQPRDNVKITETKKPSIFGDAKPVDTLAKEQEIEMKMKLNIEDSKSDGMSKTGLRGIKKSSSVIPSTVASTTASDKPSSGLEWRNPQRKDVPKSDSGPPPTSTEKSVTPALAPIPKQNIWEVRKKVKSMSSQDGADIDNNNSSVSKSIASVVTTNTNIGLAIGPSVETTELPVSSTVSTPAKPPVVISANGPYLDPKSRTPHHSMSDNSSTKSSPTAVPVNIPSGNRPISSSIDSNASTVPTNFAMTKKNAQTLSDVSKTASIPLTTGNKTCSTQNSWAKGPPKMLIEKVETNQ